MARKKLNLRFVVPTVCTTLLVGTGVVLWLKHAKPRNPQTYLQQGDTSFRARDFATAVANYSAAADLLPDDSNVHLKLARACFMNRGQGFDSNLAQAISEFTRAEELKPDSKEAWEGLLQANEAQVEIFENRPGDLRNAEALPTSINMAREAAIHLVQLEPDNLVAQEAEPILVLRVWVQNLAMPETTYEHDHPEKALTADQKAEQAIADLTKLMQAHPEDDKLPFWIAKAKIFQAQTALKSDHPETAPALLSEAASQFDASIDGSPKTVGLYINKAAILDLVQKADPNAQNWQDYRQRIHDTLDKAQSLVDPKDLREYALAKQQWALVLSGTEPTKAELVYRDLIARFPQDLMYRGQLAELLKRQPGRRRDGIAVLDEVKTLTAPPVTDVQARSRWDLMSAFCRLQRADIETDELASMAPGKAREDLIADIEQSLAEAQARMGTDFRVLRVQGRFQLTNGQVRDAIITLTSAAEKMTSEVGKPDYELLVEEAEAYRRGSQNGKAIELLETAIADPAGANNAELHFKVANLYLQDMDFAKAKPHVDWLAVRYPDNKETVALEIRALGSNPDWKAIQPIYTKLPEKTPEDMALKCSIALQGNNSDEAIRVLYLIHKAKPDDDATTSNLVQLLRATNRPDEAKAVITDAVTQHPDDSTLKVVQKLANNATREEVENDELAVINAIPEPFTREGKLAQYYALKQNPEAELSHLQAQLKLQPNDRHVLETIFIRHLESRRFADAEAMISHLAELDADQAGGLMYKTKLALAKEDVPSALIFSRQMAHDYPQFAQSFELYGEALAASGKLDDACQQFQAALALQETNVEATRNLIQYTVLQNKLEDAKTFIAKACQRFPDDPQYREMRVKFEILYDDPESVLSELTTLVAQHPEDPKNYSLLAQAQLASMKAKSDLGQADAASDYLDQAKDTYVKATARWPDDLGFANALASMYLENNDFTHAEQALQTAVDRPRWKNQPAPLILLGRVYLQANQPEKAEAALRKALECDSRSIDATLTLADCLIRQKKLDAALAVLQPATSDMRVRSKYTDLLLAMGRGPQAEVGLDEAIKANPTNQALADMRLGVYAAENSLDQGIRAATKDLETNPGDTFAYLWRGKMEASGANPDLDAALKDLIAFHNIATSNLDGCVALAQVYDMKFDHDSAIHELESALPSNPQNRILRLMLLQEYLATNPPRNIDADRLLTQTLAIPALRHDPDFETRAALLWSKRGEDDKAVTTMQDALKHTDDKSKYIRDYFDVLLTTGARNQKNLQLLLDDSGQYASDPKASWFVFSDRGSAKAGLKDDDGAMDEFATAMDRASATIGRDAQEAVAGAIVKCYGVDKALEMVLPRATNSVTWKLVAIDLYIRKGELNKGVALADSAMTLADSLTPDDRLHLYHAAVDLDLNVSPPALDKATAVCQKILAINPDDLDALDNLAAILSDLTSPPNLKDALTYSQHAYDLCVKAGRIDPRIADTQAWILIQNNDVDKGIDVMMRSIDQADFPEAHYHLAQAYMMKSPPMAEEAQSELGRATALLQKVAANGHPLDQVFKDKIDQAQKKIDDVIHDKSTAKAAT